MLPAPERAGVGPTFVVVVVTVRPSSPREYSIETSSANG
jgi:hypothetical protein